MSTAEDPDALVTLVRVGDLTTAQLLCGRLDADGIHCAIPDEHMARQTWHLTSAIGGIRVQVRRADLERAKEILAQPGGAELLANHQGLGLETGEVLTGPNGAADDDAISAGDRAAFRSLRVALVSLWLMGLIHPYSLWLAIAALRRADVTPWGRRRAGVALVISLAGCAWLALLVQHFARLGR
jgi:hypothetical protein